MSDKIPEHILRTLQKIVASLPVIVLGSGASASYGIAGMPEVAKYLVANIQPDESHQVRWNEFKNQLIQGIDLETALHSISVSSGLEHQIVVKTRELIIKKDVEIFNALVRGEVQFPLSRLLQYLHRTANPNLNIVTTNYDRLAEYAIDFAGLPFYSGFVGQYLQFFEGFTNNRRNETIELLKVHGSVDWFADARKGVVAIPDFMSNQSGATPSMVTPGIRKYEHTHNEPFRSIITRSDMVFENATSVLCIGYGFNDSHIQPKLISRMRRGLTPILIVTKTLSTSALEFISTSGLNIVIGIDSHPSGSRIITGANEEFFIEDEIWSLNGLLQLIL